MFMEGCVDNENTQITHNIAPNLGKVQAEDGGTVS